MPLFLDRRAVIAGIGIQMASTIPIPTMASASKAFTLFASGYRAEGGQGLLPLSYAPGRERWAAGTPVAAAPNISFAVHHPRHPLVYGTEEDANGSISVLRIAAGMWHRIARVPTDGASPCHVAIHPSGTALAVANYVGGSVTTFRLDPVTGLPRGGGQVVKHHGTGPDTARQESPHAHWVGFTPGREWLHAVDLGADTIFAHRFDPRTGMLEETVAAYRATPGAGPRHLVRHPSRPIAYVVSELDNRVTVLRTDEVPRFTAIADVSTLPASFRGKSQAAGIAVNANVTRLYVSNRGHDSIAVFTIDTAGGLTPIQHVGCGGRWPRHMHMLERDRRLLVTNQHSGTISTFRIGRDGRLDLHGPGVSVPGVAFIGEFG